MLVVAQEKSGIALAVGEVATHDHAVVLGLAVRADIARHMELRGVGCLARRNNILDGAVLLVVVETVVDVELHALKMVVHDEVHDACNGIGTIDRRCPAGQDFHALDGVDVAVEIANFQADIAQIIGEILGSSLR